MGSGIRDEWRRQAAGRLAEIVEMLSLLESSFSEIVHLAKTEQATGLAFSAKMLQESIVAFQDELSAFVARKLDEP